MVERDSKQPSWTKGEVFLIFITALYLVTLNLACVYMLFFPSGNRLLDSIIRIDGQNIGFYELSMKVLFSGCLGGAFYATRGLYRRLTSAGNSPQYEFRDRLNIKIWFFWYLFRPIQGAILAVIIIALLNAGFVGLENIKTSQVPSLYFQISLGFLVGYGTHEVLKKIDDIIKVTFSSSVDSKERGVNEESKSKIDENKKEGISQ